jgi:putative FmdB family regulatory protein
LPLYEYQCDACGHRFEVIQKFSDPLVAICTKCGSGPVQKLLSSPAIQFKGSGWYITDYARAGKSDSGGKDKPVKAGESSGADSKSASTSESSGDSKSESKSEGTTETKSEPKPESKSPSTS